MQGEDKDERFPRITLWELVSAVGSGLLGLAGVVSTGILPNPRREDPSFDEAAPDPPRD